MSDPDVPLVPTLENGVLTLRMNNPSRLNGWTSAMQAALKKALPDAAANPEVKALIITGTGEYYSAGADLSGSFRPMSPKALHATVEKANYELFDIFLQFPKPILAAVNGHAIGAPVTTATLCDRVIGSEQATFRTPFARFGLPPEGCSSILFERLMGAETAERILGKEGWRPTAQEALEIGLIDEVVPHDELLARAQAQAEAWIAEGYQRTFKKGSTKEELVAVNAEESRGIADAFLSAEFLMGQYRFLSKKKKTGPAMTFLAFRVTRPVWSLFL